MATVTECKYDIGAGRAMAFGLPTDKHFLITYNYWARNAEGKDELHTGEYTSAKAVPQGTLSPIRYNPEATHQNTHTASMPNPRNAMIAIGIIGSIILSLAWFAILHSCH
jgi:hypothetical protein